MPSPSDRTILHVDMDAFYAAVEVRDRPELRGRPVIVGADPRQGRGRGVVAAASYEARAFGVRSAMPISRAWRLCPQGVFLRPRFSRYEEVSQQVFEVLGGYTDRVEPISIDEAFLDLTGCERLMGPGPEAARRIKQEIRRELGLVASVGVAPNKFLAKVASDLEKPDGLTVVAPGGEAAFLAPLPVARIWGVGPKTAAQLRSRGVRTIGDLQRLGPGDLEAWFGEAGRQLWRLARGIDDRAVEPPAEPKSLGAEVTFAEDVSDRETVRLTLLDLCDRVAARLRSHGVRARGVTLKFRDAEFQTATRSGSLEPPTDLAEDLFAAVELLLARVPWPRGGMVRLVGVQAARLVPAAAGWQPGLFEADPDRRRRAARAQDEVRRRFGRQGIVRAALLRRR